MSRMMSEYASGGELKYTAVSCSERVTYLLRSDGAVDRTMGNGVISSRIEAPAGSAYVAVSAGIESSYLLRDSGEVDRITGVFGKVTSTLTAAGGSSYIAISAGYALGLASYFVRDDGRVDRSKRGRIVSTFEAPPGGVKYIDVYVFVYFFWCVAILPIHSLDTRMPLPQYTRLVTSLGCICNAC